MLGARDKPLTEDAKGSASRKASRHDVPVVALPPCDAAHDLCAVEYGRQAAKRRAAPASPSDLVSRATPSHFRSYKQSPTQEGYKPSPTRAWLRI